MSNVQRSEFTGRDSSSDAKPARRQELSEASLDDPQSGRLIDDFYTDFAVEEDDRACLERFLNSSVVDVRREALIALVFSNRPEGPKFIRYAVDALMLHALALVNDYDEATHTAVSVLRELKSRGDTEAARVLQSLSREQKWERRFR